MDRVTCDSEEIMGRVNNIAVESEEADKEAKDFLNVIEPIATKDGLKFLNELKEFTEGFVHLTGQIVELVSDAKVKAQQFINESEEYSQDSQGLGEV